MTVQEFIDMLEWCPVINRRKNKVYFLIPSTTANKPGEPQQHTGELKHIRYYPDKEYIDIEVE